MRPDICSDAHIDDRGLVHRSRITLDVLNPIQYIGKSHRGGNQNELRTRSHALVLRSGTRTGSGPGHMGSMMLSLVLVVTLGQNIFG